MPTATFAPITLSCHPSFLLTAAELRSDRPLEVDGDNFAAKEENHDGGVGDDTTTLSDKDEAARIWLARRPHRLSAPP